MPYKLTGVLALVYIFVHWGSQASARSEVFWASDPIRPDETVLVFGHDLDAVRNIRVERLPDAPSAGDGAITESEKVSTTQNSATSLKFTIPKDFRDGTFRVHLDPDGATFDLNVPTVYWLQGDQGTASRPGGWLRVLGRNIGRSPSAILTLTPLEKGRDKIVLSAARSGLWDSKFLIPSDTPPGPYAVSLWNGNGNLSSWRSAGIWQVGAVGTEHAVQLNVKSFGARGDGVQDETPHFKAALQALAVTGGTLFVPRGYYRLGDTIVLPPGTHLKGESQRLVRLIWPDFPIPPRTLIEGSTDFSIEDVMIFASNHAHIISGGFQAGTDVPLSNARDITIRNVRVRASVYRGHGVTPKQIDDRFVAALKFSSGGPDTVRLSGENLRIEGSDIYGSGRSFYLQAPRGAYVANNKFYNGRWGWYSVSGADGVIFEGNQIIGGDLQSSGGGVNTLKGEFFAQNVAFIENKFQMTHGWYGEAMTSDGPGGCYFGPLNAISESGRSLTLASEPKTQGPQKCVGAGLFILGGRGMGQVRRIAAINGANVSVDHPFIVLPDTTSTISITTLQRHYLMIGNEFSDAGVAIQLFGSSIDDVVADNISSRTGGFIARGLQYGGYFQPTWYNQFLGNQISEGDSAADAVLAVRGSQKAPNQSPLALATVIRSNVLEGGAHIEVSGYTKNAPGVKDAIVENNRVSNVDRPIRIDAGAIDVLVRKNFIDGAEMPN